MIVGEGFNTDEVLQLVFFIVLLDLLDLSGVLELTWQELLLEEVLQRKA